jgi:ornithine cyclodeaminase
MLVLGRADIRALVPMRDAIELMKIAFAELSAGRAQAPLRLVLQLPEQRVDCLTMPASVPTVRALGVKIVNVGQNNPARGLPTIHAVVTMFDHETGVPVAILDGTTITALRTGAVSGAATDLLARSDAKTLVVYGAGAQAVTQVAAVCAVRPIERIIVVGRSEEGLRRFREMLRADYPELADRLTTTTDHAAAREADIICTATTSSTPVFEATDVRPGTHVNGIGAYTPTMQEIPADLVVRATVVVDQAAAAMAEAGDLIIPLRQGLVEPSQLERELGKVVSGEMPGRTSEDEITFFKSVGNAVQDVVVGQRAVDRATELGRGQSVSFE